MLTLFPNVFSEYFNSSILKKALDNKIIEIEIVDFREFSNDKHKKVDDAPFGGGPGMIIKLQPIVDAIRKYKTQDSLVVLLDPCGKQFDNEIISNLKSFSHIILICGRYEGFDERILNYVDCSISIGDYVLSGGELAAMIVVDATSRKVNGVLNKESLYSESFEDGLLDYPTYTRPEDFEGFKIPKVLLSGNHSEINKYRDSERILKTKKYRNDLFKKYKYGGK
ncbi:MAG: tRNA (guanosine(37)-N1)-methyltransferase TrmD [Malacoplasma sp.]